MEHEPSNAAEALAHALDAFFVLSHDPICLAGADGYFKRLNLAWEAALGYPLEKLLARPWIELVHPADVPATIAAARTLERTQLVDFENRYRHADGSWKRLSWRATRWWGGLTIAIVRVVPDPSFRDVSGIHRFPKRKRR